MPKSKADVISKLTINHVLVIGLGYVGLPVAALVANSGKYQVTGFDLSQDKISAIKSGHASWVDEDIQSKMTNSKLAVTNSASELGLYDYILLCVPTPIDEHDLPDLSPVLSAVETATDHIKPGGLIILESTVNPGVCEEVLIPLLSDKGLQVGQDVYLAHCPERIDPGNPDWPLNKIPRVLGADSLIGRQKAHDFYASWLDAPIKLVSSLRAAEASKIVENAFRDINIAFVNELAQSFAHFDLDVVEVLEAAATKPFGFMAHYPGCGVGGHCIPVDPYYLIESAHIKGFEHRFLKLARDINKGMPAYTVELWRREMEKLDLSFEEDTVGVLGISYKGGIGDQRNSPAVEIWNLLKAEAIKAERFDPFIVDLSTVKSLSDLRRNQAVKSIIIATKHAEFIKSLESDDWPHLKLIIDGRNCLRKWPKQVVYKGIGR